MAQVLDELTPVFLPIVKWEKAEDGTLTVTGKVTNDEIDLDDQIVDKEFARKALDEWFTAAANVREMHQPSAVGKGTTLSEEDDGFHLVTRVVDPLAARKVEEGVYTGYSVGIARPRIIRDNKASGGRIVDGRIVEVSLVDRPALPTAKFMVAKMAGGAVEYVGAEVEIEKAVHEHEHTHPGMGPDGEDLTHTHPHRHAPNAAPHGKNHMHGHPDGEPDDGEAEAMKAEAAECKTCKGKGTILEGHRKCPDCGGTGKARAEKREMDTVGGESVDRDKIPAEDFAGPNRTFPITNPASVAAAAHLIGHADNPEQVKRRIIAIAQRKGKEFVAEIPDSWTEDAKKAIRHAHDITCAVYSTEALKAAYPDAQITIGTDALDALRTSLSLALAGEATSDDIARMAAAYHDVTSLAAMPDLATAREELHRQFVAEYAGKADIPKPGDPPNPASFRRPYLTAGTQREDGEGAPSPHMPGATHVPEPSDFDRGYLGGDEQREAPGDKADSLRLGPGLSGADYLKAFNGQREQAAVAFLHDSIAAVFPDMCYMDNSDSTVWDNRATSTPETIHPAAPPEPVKAVEPANTVAMADVEKLIRDAIDEQNKRHADAIAELQARIHELEAAPDPTRAPIRNAALDGRAEKRASAEEDAAASEARAREARIAAWQRRADTTADPVVRDEIRTALKALGADLTK